MWNFYIIIYIRVTFIRVHSTFISYLIFWRSTWVIIFFSSSLLSIVTSRVFSSSAGKARGVTIEIIIVYCIPVSVYKFINVFFVMIYLLCTYYKLINLKIIIYNVSSVGLCDRMMKTLIWKVWSCLPFKLLNLGLKTIFAIIFIDKTDFWCFFLHLLYKSRSTFIHVKKQAALHTSSSAEGCVRIHPRGIIQKYTIMICKTSLY